MWPWSAFVPVLVLAAAHLAAPVAAQDLHHKCPAPGTEVTTTQTNTPIRYDGQDGVWCLRSQNGKPINRELGHYRFYADNANRTQLYHRYYETAVGLWPLTPGKSLSFPYSSVSDGSGAGSMTNNNYYRATVTVEPARDVTVPAGRFSALPIVLEIRGERGNYHHSRSTYYYAPDIGTNVKFDYRLVAGSAATTPGPWELVSLRPPGSPPIAGAPQSVRSQGDGSQSNDGDGD